MKGRSIISVELDDDFVELLTALGKETGLSPSDIVRKLLPAHINELWEFRIYLDGLLHDSPQRERARYAIHNYGPDTLIDAIKRLDPTYKTVGERFEEGIGR